MTTDYRLSDEQRHQIAARAYIGEKQERLADEFNVTQQYVSELLKVHRPAFAIITRWMMEPETPQRKTQKKRKDAK